MSRVFNSRVDKLERCSGCGFYGHSYSGIGIIASERIVRPNETYNSTDMPRPRQRTNFQRGAFQGPVLGFDKLLKSCIDNCGDLPDGQHGDNCELTQTLEHAIKFVQNTRYTDLRRALTNQDRPSVITGISPINTGTGIGRHFYPSEFLDSGDLHELIKKSSPNGILSRPEIFLEDESKPVIFSGDFEDFQKRLDEARDSLYKKQHPAKNLFFGLLNSLGYRRGNMGGSLEHPDVNPVAPIPGFQVNKLNTREPKCPNCLRPIADDEPSLRIERIKQAGYPVISSRPQKDERRFRKFMSTTFQIAPDSLGWSMPESFIAIPDKKRIKHPRTGEWIFIQNPAFEHFNKISDGRRAHWQKLYNKFQTAAQINWNTVPSPVPPGNLGELDAIGLNDMRLTSVVRMPMHVGCLAGEHPALEGRVPSVNIKNCPALGRTNRWSTDNGGAAWITSGYGGGARFRRSLTEPIPQIELESERTRRTRDFDDDFVDDSGF